MKKDLESAWFPPRICLRHLRLQFIFRYFMLIRIHLKNMILVQVQGVTEFQPADILKCFEELKRGRNTEIGTKDFFEMDSSNL